MFVREFGLVHNPGDAERFVRLVRWEGRWLPADDEGFEVRVMVPVLWEWSELDVSNPRTLSYDGPQWRMVPTAIVEQPIRRWPTVWPRDAPTETETMRRMRIRALRAACHVDPVTAKAEPAWMPPTDAHEVHKLARALSDYVADERAAA
jgi:hypothetical protein